MNRRSLQWCTAATFVCVLLSTPARAQPIPPPATPPAPPAKPAIGENYVIEIAAGAWNTMPSTARLSDTENSVTGTDVDFKQQLGLGDQRFPEFQVTWRVTPRNKLRTEYIPLNYQQTGTPTADLNFAGQAFAAGQAVTSSLHWADWQWTYEFDLASGRRGYVGGIVGANDVIVNGVLANDVASVSAHVQIPMPGVGAAARWYPLARLSFTGQFIVYDLLNKSANTHGHAFDLDATATANLSRHLGIQGGYRSFDITYIFAGAVNAGTLTVRGPYVGGAVRF